MQKNSRSTSWQKVSKWYHKEVGTTGHYYHQHVIFPGINRLISLNHNSRVLDLACGQGVLARMIDPDISYVGIDLAPSLIDEAKKQDQNNLHHFQVGDVSKKLNLKSQNHNSKLKI